jgi:DNA-binding transcriptional LysR family regulator
LNSTECIIAAVEAGLGIGFVPYLAIEKALALGSVTVIQLDNGPIRRQLSIVLLNGPDPRGPVAQLLELLREYGATKRHAPTKILMNEDLNNVVVMAKAPTVENEEMAP